MSRVGNKPITIPDDVTVEVKDKDVTVKGPKGELNYKVHPLIDVEVDGDTINVIRHGDDKDSQSQQGTTRANISNMVTGVKDGYEKRLEMSGVGYRAQMQGDTLSLSVGKSHPVEFVAPEGITIECPSNTQIVVKGIDKSAVGQLAAEIRGSRPPEPYKGKGIHYEGEHILRKEGKTGK